MYATQFLLIAFIFALCISNINNASLTRGDDDHENIIASQGLYDAKDDVYILNANNFNDQVYNAPHAWYIEFYNTWCGHCQRFAPTWKALSTTLKGWNSMLRVAALDCANDDNSPICRDMEIMEYPSLRYFHEQYQQGAQNLGLKVIKAQDVYANKRNLLEVLVGEQIAGRGRIYPNLAPYTFSSYQPIFHDVAKLVKYVILILEDANSFYGPELIINLRACESIAIKYALNNNTDLHNSLPITSFPAVVVFSRRSNYSVIEGEFNTADDVHARLKDYLKLKNIYIPNAYTAQEEADVQLRHVASNLASEIVLIEEEEQKRLKQRAKAMGDVVLLADLETALRYSLQHEIPRVKLIAGEKYRALVSYLRVLQKYFPFNAKGDRFIGDLLHKVESSSSGISGKEVLAAVKGVEPLEKGVWSTEPQWQGCISSQAGKRGYPCGLWKTFHYLTVNAAASNLEDGDQPREILDAMHAYIKNFFGCSECSGHFQEMATEDHMNNVATYDEAILWLWKAHNKVNKRLAGDQTEDPEFPKVQFPIADRCVECRNADGSWNTAEMLHYLKNMYNRPNIVNLKMGGEMLRIVDGPLVSSGSSGLFHRVDASMCFAIYVVSFLLVYVVIRIFLKRGYRKRLYVYDLLGKV